MFGFIFKSKVLGVLNHEFGWELSVKALGSIYKAPLDDICKSVKNKGGNEFDAAFTFLFFALDKSFPTDISQEELDNIMLVNGLKYISRTVFTDLHNASYSEFIKSRNY